jgi:hypothetical protein
VIHLLVDTCVWLDIALDQRLAPLLDVIDRALQRQAAVVVVPDVIVIELDRNAEAVQHKTKKAFEAMVRGALDASKVLSSGEDQADLQRTLSKVASNLPRHEGALNSRISRIRAMLVGNRVRAQASTALMMVAALRRGLEKKAPFIKGKNSCGDALLLEHFAAYGGSLPAGDRLYFVTSNTADFSSPTDNRVPHADIAGHFNTTDRQFSINLAECMGPLDAQAVTPAVVQAAEEAAERSMTACPAGGEHEFDPDRGANLRSRYGGLTWHLFCKRCGAKHDTGESYE